jgi:hypothetical protein
MVTSESDFKTETNYKPGGTMTTIVGKWQAWVTEKGMDPAGLGHWSYMIIGSNRKKLVVITAYKSCKTTGLNTTWTQQWILLREQTQDPDPIREFCQDLNNTLRKWKQTDHEIILLIDANEEIGQKPGGLGEVMASNGLYDIMANQHYSETYPPTYARGTRRIDYIFGSDRIQTYCKSSGILPLHIGYPSNHRAIFIRIDLQAILSTEIHPIESSATRLIHSATPKEREKFLSEVHRHYESQNLYERLSKLWEVPTQEWNEKYEDEYNACDEQHITGMLASERKTCREKFFAWSPTFSKAIENIAFWKIILSLRRNHSRPSKRIKSWVQERFGIDDLLDIPTNEIKSRLRQAQKN